METSMIPFPGVFSLQYFLKKVYLKSALACKLDQNCTCVTYHMTMVNSSVTHDNTIFFNIKVCERDDKIVELTYMLQLN